MLMFLGNAGSTKAHPNENLGRELLELHTVGIGNYTEEDVKNSARILTGHRADLYKTWEPYYSAKDHWTGPVQVMGFRHPNADADGRAVTDAYLSYLAHHPATARRIATKLVKAFVADAVPTTLVDRLAESTSPTAPRSCRCSRRWSARRSSSRPSTRCCATVMRTCWRPTGCWASG